MINHHWTLLLNEPGTHVTPEGCAWDRYIPEDFVPVIYPAWLEEIRKTLVGSGSYYDRSYRVDELIRLCLQPRYRSSMVWPDDRRIEPTTDLVDYPFGLSVLPISGANRLWLQVDQTLRASTIWREWRVSTIMPVVEVKMPNGSFKEYAAETNMRIPLDQGLTAVIQQPTDGDAWIVQAVLRPSGTFCSVMSAIRKIADHRMTALVNQASSAMPDLAETYKTLTDSDFDEDRAVGVVLAFVAAAEYSRT